jgi:RNA polymerase sigma-70 factor, ECF subfamily
VRDAPCHRQHRHLVYVTGVHRQVPQNLASGQGELARGGLKQVATGPCGKLTNFLNAAVYSIDESHDAALIDRCQAGDTEAFEALVRQYQRGLFNIALRMLGSYEDARDATQTAFIKAYEHLDRFDPAQRFFSWIYRILKNECLNVLRARRQSEPVSLDWPAAGVPDTVEAEERTRAIQRALLGLSDDYREVMVLRHFTDLSYDEIASTLGIPVKTVKSRLYSARQRLSELLIEWRVAR